MSNSKQPWRPPPVAGIRSADLGEVMNGCGNIFQHKTAVTGCGFYLGGKQARLFIKSMTKYEYIGLKD
jgi:hypothetical protein